MWVGQENAAESEVPSGSAEAASASAAEREGCSLAAFPMFTERSSACLTAVRRERCAAAWFPEQLIGL
jgi:hypothetical protein